MMSSNKTIFRSTKIISNIIFFLLHRVLHTRDGNVFTSVCHSLQQGRFSQVIHGLKCSWIEGSGGPWPRGLDQRPPDPSDLTPGPWSVGPWFGWLGPRSAEIGKGLWLVLPRNVNGNLSLILSILEDIYHLLVSPILLLPVRHRSLI